MNFFCGINDSYKLEEIYLQIKEYYEFHKNIENYFNSGFNNDAPGIIETFYFIDSNWITSWKIYTNYDIVVKNLENGSKFENLTDSGVLKNNFEYRPPSLISGKSKEDFLNKSLYNEKDFDCLINKSTYDVFGCFSSFWKFFSLDAINGVLYDKMLVLLIRDQNRIKIIYKGEMEGINQVIQLSIDFPPSKWYFGFCNNESYDNFTKCFILDKCDKLMEKLNEINIGVVEQLNLTFKNNTCTIINNYLFQKYNCQKQDISKINFDNIKKERFIGLENIGATCYMNATLQCLVNIKELTNYLMIPSNYYNIMENGLKCEILNCYCFLLKELCCNESITNYFSPKNFKDVISLKNPLFKGIQANDSKDLIYFLIEQMNSEFNQINMKIKNINIKIDSNNNNFINNETMQTDRNLMLTNFIKEYSSKNNNIVSNLFFSIIENETICNGCNVHKYNFQTNFSIEFPLEKIYNKIYGQQNNINRKKLTLIECFNNYNETNYFQGENSMYCNTCKSQQNAVYNTKIFSLSPLLVIILNRGKGNVFNCYVDFEEDLNLQNLVQTNKSNMNYRLIGVVSHLGSSDMSGHFIAYCRHRVVNEWYCYNDAMVVKCNNQLKDFKNGESYILFYESKQGNNNILFDDEYLLNQNNDNLNQNQNSFNNNLNMNFQNTNNSNNNINSSNQNINNFNNNMSLKNINNMNYNMNNIPINNSFNSFNNFPINDSMNNGNNMFINSMNNNNNNMNNGLMFNSMNMNINYNNMNNFYNNNIFNNNFQ